MLEQRLEVLPVISPAVLFCVRNALSAILKKNKRSLPAAREREKNKWSKNRDVDENWVSSKRAEIGTEPVLLLSLPFCWPKFLPDNFIYRDDGNSILLSQIPLASVARRSSFKVSNYSDEQE